VLFPLLTKEGARGRLNRLERHRAREAWYRMTRACIACTAVIFAVLLSPGGGAAAELGPQTVVRQFCEADGNGQRVSIPGWAALAPLVAWAYEPAWDHLALISGYTVGSPQPAPENMFAVEVHYDVVGQLSPLGFDPEVHAETVTYGVQPDEQGNWHIVGPPPPPHVFANQVDIEATRRSLSSGGVNFLADTVFVWQMFRSAGWNIPFESTADLLSGATYRVVDNAKPGDIVVYLRGETPYHVGVLEAENQVVSSTLNAGITRTTVGAFPGAVRYLRLVQPKAVPAASFRRQVHPEATPSPTAFPTMHLTPTIRTHRPTPLAGVTRKSPAKLSSKRPVRMPATVKRKAAKSSHRQHRAKPPARKRVKPKQQGRRELRG
jgi:hypothetical protein